MLIFCKFLLAERFFWVIFVVAKNFLTGGLHKCFQIALNVTHRHFFVTAYDFATWKT